TRRSSALGLPGPLGGGNAGHPTEPSSPGRGAAAGLSPEGAAPDPLEPGGEPLRAAPPLPLGGQTARAGAHDRAGLVLLARRRRHLRRPLPRDRRADPRDQPL